MGEYVRLPIFPTQLWDFPGEASPYSRLRRHATCCTGFPAGSQRVAVREIKVHRRVSWRLKSVHRFGTGKRGDARRTALTESDQRFDGRLFNEQRRSLRVRTRKISREPPPDLRYTVFAARLFWVVVVVPFLTGAAFALVMVR